MRLLPLLRFPPVPSQSTGNNETVHNSLTTNPPLLNFYPLHDAHDDDDGLSQWILPIDPSTRRRLLPPIPTGSLGQIKASQPAHRPHRIRKGLRRQARRRHQSQCTPLFYLPKSDLATSLQKVAAAWSKSNFPPRELDKMFRAIEAVYKANRTFLSVSHSYPSTPSYLVAETRNHRNSRR